MSCAKDVTVLVETLTEDNVQKQLNTTHQNTEVLSTDQCCDKVKKVRLQSESSTSTSTSTSTSSSSSSSSSSSATDSEGSPVKNLPPSYTLAELRSIPPARGRNPSRKRKRRIDLAEIISFYIKTQQQQHRQLMEMEERMEQRDREYMDRVLDEQRQDRQERYRFMEKIVDKLCNAPHPTTPTPAPQPSYQHSSPLPHPSYQRSPSPHTDAHPSSSGHSHYHNLYS